MFLYASLRGGEAEKIIEGKKKKHLATIIFNNKMEIMILNQSTNVLSRLKLYLDSPAVCAGGAAAFCRLLLRCPGIRLSECPSLASPSCPLTEI